jgi:GNAT superfamily N-acetyltransferase
MEPGIIIRPFTSADSIPEITRLLHLAYRSLLDQGMRYNASHQDDQATLRRCLQGETYLAIKDEKIVGTITLKSLERTKGSSWYDRPNVASFGQFAVQPELQKKGIGTKLLDTIENRARELSIDELALDTADGASNLIAMYESRGYRFIEYANWETTNYRSVILSKKLSCL